MVGEAADGSAALAAAAELSPELVLLDVQLPDMDGFEVARRLTADGDGPGGHPRLEPRRLGLRDARRRERRPRVHREGRPLRGSADRAARMTRAARLRFLLGVRRRGRGGERARLRGHRSRATTSAGRVAGAVARGRDRAVVHRLRAARVAAPAGEQHGPPARRDRVRLGCRDALERRTTPLCTRSARSSAPSCSRCSPTCCSPIRRAGCAAGSSAGSSASGYGLALVANVVALFFDPSPQCDNCPTNVLLVTESPRTANVVTLVDRPPRAAAARRRRGPDGAALACGEHGGPARARLDPRVGRRGRPAARGLVRGRPALTRAAGSARQPGPAGVRDGAVLLRRRPAAEPARARGASPTSSSTSPSRPRSPRAEEWLRRVLGDPSLRLGLWFLERNQFIGADGEPFSEEDCAEDRVAIGFEDELGRPLALVEHDPALLDERELLDAALAGARLALQRNRLQWELKMQLAELKRSRVRLVEAAAHRAPAARAEPARRRAAAARLPLAGAAARPGEAPLGPRRDGAAPDGSCGGAPARAAGAARARPRPAPRGPRGSGSCRGARVARGPLGTAGRALGQLRLPARRADRGRGVLRRVGGARERREVRAGHALRASR